MAEDDYWLNIGADLSQEGVHTLPGAIEAERFKEGLPLVQKMGQVALPQDILPDDFFCEDGTIFAVLDAGCLEDLPVLFEAENLAYVSLFSGELATSAREAAPYLVELTRDS